MSSDAARYIWNTRERLVSTGLNETQDLHHRLLLEMIGTAISTGETGVINGLSVSMPNVNTVEIAPGFAQVLHTAAVYPDSQRRLVELDTTRSVGLAAADVGNPRWDGVYIGPRSTVQPNVGVDIFDIDTGTFASQLRPKRALNDPIVAIVQGSPSATPAIPGNPGTAGQPYIPLAFIWRPTGGGGATVDQMFNARAIMRRVINDTWASGALRDAQPIRGGGVVVTTGGSIRPNSCSGSFGASGVIFTIGTNCTVVFTDAEYRDQDTLSSIPVADTPVYWYAHPVPIPINGFSQSELNPSVDAVPLLPGLSASQHNCMILGSTTPPDNGIAQGRPTSNLRSITATFGDNVIAQDDCVYLGSTDYNVTAVRMNEQSLAGSAHVIRGDASVPQGSALSAAVINLWTGGSLGQLPATAFRVFCRASYNVDSGGFIRTEYTDGAGHRNASYGINIGAGTDEYEFELCLYPDSSGQVTINDIKSSGTINTGLIHSIAYDDIVLARR